MSRCRLSAVARAGCCALALLALAFHASGKSREECEREFMPQTGHPGKDVIWVPTNDALVGRMLRLAQVSEDDRVYDLGAGDGKIAIAAAREFGARAVGVEYDADMARLARCYVEAERLDGRVQIVQGDIFEIDFSKATVITLYLLPELNMRLRPALLEMPPGTRIVSHSFLMGDWEPDDRTISEDGQAYLWVVPANVAGTWTFRGRDRTDRVIVELDQTFQQVSGRAAGAPLARARLQGSRLTLLYPENGTLTRLVGRVEGTRIEATITRGDVTRRYLGTRASADAGP